MRVLFARPDVYVRAHVLVAFAIGVIGVVGAAVFYVAARASICQVLPVFSVGWALVAALIWELRRTRFDTRGRFARFAIELIAFAVLALTAAVWCRMHPHSL
jgi:hypothetical protein